MSNLKDDYKRNFNKYKIGFCISYKFYQENVCKNILDFKKFITDNSDFLNPIITNSVCDSLDNFNSLFFSVTDIYKNIDSSEKYLDYLKEFN